MKDINNITPENLFKELGKTMVVKTLKSDGLEYIDKEIKKAEHHLNCLKLLRAAKEKQMIDAAVKSLIRANKEYGDAEPFYPDDCQEFNVPNMC